MQDELEQLREENERLKIIIKALTDKLKLTENIAYSNVEKNIGKNVSDDVSEKNIGVNRMGYSHDEKT